MTSAGQERNYSHSYLFFKVLMNASISRTDDMQQLSRAYLFFNCLDECFAFRSHALIGLCSIAVSAVIP